jgi:hypothetical protein
MSEPVVPAVPPDVAIARRRFRLVKLGAVALVLLVGVGLGLRGYDLKGAFEQGL